MADKYQNAILDSIESIVDSKMKKNGTSYYINGKVIDKNSRLYNVANHQHTCTLQEKGSNNEKCQSCPYNNQYLDDRSKQVRRIYDSENTCVGYYEVVYEDIFARSGLVPTVGDSVQIMVKNGNFSTKFIDDVLEGKGTMIGQNGENNDSLLPSIPLSLSIGDVTYDSANVSWTVGEDLKKVLGGYTLVWGNSDCPPYPNINQTANFDKEITSATIQELNESTTYTAWIIARDLYGKYQKANNFDCIQTFTTPAKPAPPSYFKPHQSLGTKTPIEDWYDESSYQDNPDNYDWDSFALTGNFDSEECVEITNDSFKQLINKLYCIDDDSVSNLTAYGIEYTMPYDFGCLWKDPSKLKLLYIQKGNLELPEYKPEYDSGEYDDYTNEQREMCADNYYSRTNFDSRTMTNAYGIDWDKFPDTTHNIIGVAFQLSCYEPEDRVTDKWIPNDINNQLTDHTRATSYMLFLGVDINGTPSPHQCVAVLISNTDMWKQVSLTREDIHNDYGNTFTITVGKESWER